MNARTNQEDKKPACTTYMYGFLEGSTSAFTFCMPNDPLNPFNCYLNLPILHVAKIDAKKEDKRINESEINYVSFCLVPFDLIQNRDKINPHGQIAGLGHAFIGTDGSHSPASLYTSYNGYGLPPNRNFNFCPSSKDFHINFREWLTKDHQISGSRQDEVVSLGHIQIDPVHINGLVSRLKPHLRQRFNDKSIIGRTRR